MPKQIAFRPILAAFVVTIVIAVVALIVVVSVSTHGSSTNGISVYAGGLSRNYVELLAFGLVLVFIASLFVFRRTFK